MFPSRKQNGGYELANLEVYKCFLKFIKKINNIKETKNTQKKSCGNVFELKIA
jgi:hypothetical protein